MVLVLMVLSCPYPYYGGAAWGPRGAAVWGPGGWAATTGNVYHRWGATTAVTRGSAGYNAWTGDRWSTQSGMSYNSRTGNLAAGQRSAVGNVYTGNYATGARGAVTNTRTGTTVEAQRGSAGNAYTGREVSGGRVEVTNPNTGQSGSAARISGEQGTIARVGDDIYAGKDGNIYRRGEGGWEQHTPSGKWSGVRDGSRTTDLQAQQRARSTGQQRVNQYRGAGGTRGGGGRRR